MAITFMSDIKCMLHGSFRKDFELIKEVSDLFNANGIKVIAPDISEIVGETEGFIHLKKDQSKDARVTELLYLNKIMELGSNGFSYYVNSKGTLGTTTSYEIAIDQLTNTRYLFMEKVKDHPIYVPQNSIWKPKELIDYIKENNHYPPPIFAKDEEALYKMVSDLILPGSIIAVGAIIVDYSNKRYKSNQERDVLLVKTHKWQDRFSIVGGKVKRNERLSDALKREILEETRLDCSIEESICTFDEIKNSGYFEEGVHRVFTDNIVKVGKRRATLNEEAEEYLWMPPTIALKELNIEPNARKTLELYRTNHIRFA